MRPCPILLGIVVFSCISNLKDLSCLNEDAGVC